MKIARKEYKDFVESHILRPYQGSVFGMDEPLNYSKDFYKALPQLFADNPEWEKLVFNRISEIFDSIDDGFFPIGRSGTIIMENMERHGVRIIHD